MKTSAAAAAAIDLRVFQAMPGNSIVLLPDSPVFTIIAATDNYCKTSGRTAQELIGKGIFEAFPAPPHDREQIGRKQLRTSLETVIQKKASDRLPLVRYDVQNADGSFDERYWSAINVPVPGENGEALYIVHTAEEMTLQVKAERSANRIKSLEASYNIFMQAPVTIGVVKGGDYIIELANDSLLEVWGRSADVIGKSLFEAIPELKDQGFRELLDQTSQTGEPFYAYEHPIRLVRRGKEEVLYFDFVYKPYYEDGKKEPVGILAVGHDVTKQVESRHKFKTVIEEAKNPIFILMGEDLVLDTANQAVFDLWQVGPEELGKPFLEILPEMKEQGFDELIRNVLFTGEPFYGKEMATVFKRKGGVTETGYFDFSYQPYRSPEGSITGVLAMAADVTERKKAEEALRQSESRFRTLAEALPQMVWMRNTNGQIEYGSQHWEEYSGIRGVSEAWRAMVHPDDWKPVMDAWQRDSAKGQGYRYEVRLKNKDGEYRWHYASGEPIRDKEGNVVKWIGVLTDIHTQKTFSEKLEKEVAERTRELQNSESFLQQLIDSSIEFITVLDKDLRFVTVNKSVEKLVHVSREELKNRFVFDLNPKLENTPFHEAILKALKGETIHLDKVNSVAEPNRFIDTYVIPYVAEGKVEGAILMARDITPLVQTEKKLEQVVKELERSNEDLQQFAHVASHDLKEPVRKVMTFCNLLKQELGKDISDKAANYLSRIESASIRMYSMIDGVLLYSSLNALEQTKEVIDLNEVIQNIEADVEVTIVQKGAAFRYSGLPKVEGSAILIYQLFYNLINNSLKFAKAHEKPLIEIWAEKAEAEEIKSLRLNTGRKYLKILLADNGIGFDQSEAEKIFQTFTRLNAKDKYEGTGLGLSLCRKIVERHGGIIYAEGAEGKGAKFTIVLPND